MNLRFLSAFEVMSPPFAVQGDVDACLTRTARRFVHAAGGATVTLASLKLPHSQSGAPSRSREKWFTGSHEDGSLAKLKLVSEPVLARLANKNIVVHGVGQENMGNHGWWLWDGYGIRYCPANDGETLCIHIYIYNYIYLYLLYIIFETYKLPYITDTLHIYIYSIQINTGVRTWNVLRIIGIMVSIRDKHNIKCTSKFNLHIHIWCIKLLHGLSSWRWDVGNGGRNNRWAIWTFVGGWGALPIPNPICLGIKNEKNKAFGG